MKNIYFNRTNVKLSSFYGFFFSLIHDCNAYVGQALVGEELYWMPHIGSIFTLNFRRFFFLDLFFSAIMVDKSSSCKCLLNLCGFFCSDCG